MQSWFKPEVGAKAAGSNLNRGADTKTRVENPGNRRTWSTGDPGLKEN